MEEPSGSPSKKVFTPAEALVKIRNYCAYQERSHREVKVKLLSFGLAYAIADELLTQLITEGFLNEERFARAFAGGKFRLKKWGRLKIENELKGRGLTARCIALGLSEIDTGDYLRTLEALIEKKAVEYRHLSPSARKKKLAAYARAKGYEPDLIWELLKSDA